MSKCYTNCKEYNFLFLTCYPSIAIHGKISIIFFLSSLWSIVSASSMARQPDSGMAMGEGLSNPFFLHYSNNPNSMVWLLFLNLSLVRNENYNTWSQQSQEQDWFHWGVHITKPFDSSDPNFLASKQWNTMIFSWLLIWSVSKGIVSIILYADSIQEIWNNLKERFSLTNAHRPFQFQQEIYNLHQEQQSVPIL